MTTVRFVDTSVLCNLVPVPGRCQQEATARDEFARFYTAGDELVLPVTAVVETGNFIAQLDDGGLRRRAALSLEDWLGSAVSQTPPFSLHDFSWDASTVRRFLDGAGTGETWIDLATRKIGAGDLLILTELSEFRRRLRSPVVLWTYDDGLARCAEAAAHLA